MILWNSYLDECMEALETSEEAIPSDKLLCRSVRLQHIAHRASTRFASEHGLDVPHMTKPALREAKSEFKEELRKWKEENREESRGSFFPGQERIVR
jgi:hypothetical protein